MVLEGPAVDREGFQLSWNWWTGRPGRGSEATSRSFTRRWIVDLTAGRVTEAVIDDLVVEFPTINNERLGREHRYQYAVSFPDDHGIGGYGVVKYDRATGGRQVMPVGDGRLPSEAVFVSAADATAEDHGYLLTVVSDLKEDASQLLILDGTDLQRPPVATIHLPRRVVAGIHGSWIADN